MSRDGWSTLLEVYDRIEAEILKESLESMGIPATLFDESAGTLYPTTFGPLAKVEVCVPDERLKEAEAWLESYNKGELRDDDAELSNPDNK
jgi:hypothetical protein